MKFKANQIYHVFNQGNNRQRIFQTESDYETFLNYVRKFLLSNTDLICYCLMPNHFHFLVHTNEYSSVLVKQGGLIIDTLTNGMRKLLSGYARVFNSKYERSGSLFRQKTKAKWITGLVRKEKRVYTAEEYCTNCFQYIHANPVAAGLVTHPSDWKWSSYNFYAGNSN
jgi:REP element-mobilizing transposase RayT